MGPKFCENCKHLKADGACSTAKTCAKWRVWFAREWQRIRKAAGKTKQTAADQAEE